MVPDYLVCSLWGSGIRGKPRDSSLNRLSAKTLPGSTNEEGTILLELVLKLEIALSNVEESDDSRGFRTGSKKPVSFTRDKIRVLSGCQADTVWLTISSGTQSMDVFLEFSRFSSTKLPFWRKIKMDFRMRTLITTFSLLSVTLLTPCFAQDKDKDDKKEPGTVAVFDLGGAITDKPTPDDPIFGSIGNESLRSFTGRLKKASEDADVAAVVLLGASSVGHAQSEEIAEAIRETAAKKPVYAHADSLKTAPYATLSGATKICVSPTGDVWINGIYGEQMYLRGLLDMLQVQPDFLTCGDYKSAAEMFMRKGPSEQSQEMSKWLYDGIYAGLKSSISQGRKVDDAQVEKWINKGLYSAETAKEAGLTDEVFTREQLTSFIKKTHGVTVKFDKKYGKKTGKEIDLNNPFAALQLWAEILSGPKQRRSTKDAIAIVHIDGAIYLGKKQASPFGATEGAFSEEIRKALDSIAAEPRIRGVILRVNSPGGSATASEIMLQAITELQKKKPVVVSMGNYAASGGYYVSCRANRIFANPSTITGSIGVVAGKLATAKLWNRVGINFEPIKRGDKADLLHSSKPFSNEDRDELQGWMDSIYGVFKGHVTSGREGKLSKDIDEIAGGRVYTGAQALELGLVDELGSLDDAIDYLVKDLDLKDYEVRTVPRAKNFMEVLVEDLAPPKSDDDKRLSLGIWSALTPTLQQLDPLRVEMIQEALLQLDFLAEERVMLTIPVIRFH